MTQDSLLHGAGAIAGIVAVEPYPTAGTATLYRRTGDGVERETVPLQAWLIARKPLDGAVELTGHHPLRYLLTSSDARAVTSQAQSLASDQRLTYVDPVTAQLVSSGETFYRGLRFSDLRRLQFDLETLDVYPDRDGAEICLIGVCDNRGFERVLSLDAFPNEAAMIAEFARIVRERDPDIVEGHNVFNFDLWYLHERAKRAGVPLVLGRDGRTPLWLDESLRRSVPNGMTAKYYRIEGRQIVDTFYGVMRWDVGRKLPNYKLKQVVKHLGIGDDTRAMVDASNMRRLWNDPESRAKLIAYCLDDARDTARLSELVTPNEFYQAQMVPESLQALAFVGIGSRIERLMVRAYLHARASIPRPKPTTAVAGGYTEAFARGVFHDVAKCDVESLYPSLMVARGIAPADDDLGVFLPMLASLRARRVEQKRAAALALSEERGEDYLAADGLQSAFKILINSFYGFLGTNGLHFNDPAAAGRVTEAGREVMARIVEELRRAGCTVIEADTDGAFFQPPAGADAETVVARVGETLPDGLNLAFEERYAAMLSLKAKNYALRRTNGELILRGSALRSGRDEPFGRTLMKEIVTALMDGHDERVEGIVRAAVDRAAGGTMHVEDFTRRESVTSKTFVVPGNRRLAQALGERGVAIGDKVRIYQRNDGQLALEDEYAGDEDREYLVRRIADFAARFGDLIPQAAARAASANRDQLSLL
ncbi:MAG TPA: 3'-5' exonuclease [Candidatus Eremiobacteraceae bacterium]|nr:3'-5' exonuclease [Candidatus Eremiobacteraceae bacterium]